MSSGYNGNLDLYAVPYNTVNPIESIVAGGQFVASTLPFTSMASFNYNFTAGSQYIIAVENPPLQADPGININFNPATVPLPASLPMLGGALAVLGVAHRLRKARA